jgi:VWFA-related protein
VKRSIIAIPALAAFGLLLCLAAPQQAPSQPPAKQAEPPKQTETPPAPQPAPQAKAAEQENAKFFVESREVMLPVTVTDDRGYFVSNLTTSDFRVLDEGRPQRIKVFNHNERQPIVIGFLLDLSSASAIHWKDYQEGVEQLIWALLPGEKNKYRQGYLITYGNEADLVVNTTWDGQSMVEKIEKMKPGGSSALYDAIYMACTSREVVKGEPYEPRRVIIIIGDGHNNASSKSLGEVIEIAKRQMVTIYGLSTVAYGFDSAEQDVLERMAFETGGMVEYPLSGIYKDVSGYLSSPRDAGNYAYEPGTGAYASAKLKNIITSVTHLQGELTTQYVLRYVPDIDQEDRAKIFRHVKVELPNLPNALVKTRDGYYPNSLPAPEVSEGLERRGQAPAAPGSK